MTSGFAVVTLTSPPINSGGSIAMYSGESFARVSASEMSSAQATTSRPSCWQRGMLFAISSHATLRSLWLISVPADPAARRVSGGVQPVVGPGPTASTCCANTGTWTSFATCATSVVGGQSTIDAPVSSATAANRLARSQPFLPRTSGWVLKFRTIVGRRIGPRKAVGSEIGLAGGNRYLRSFPCAATSCKRSIGPRPLPQSEVGTTRISIGKLRGLQQISDDTGRFTMIAMDQRGSLQKMLHPENPKAATYAEMEAVKF